MTMIYWREISNLRNTSIVDEDTHWTVILSDGVKRTAYWLTAESSTAQKWLKQHTTVPLSRLP